MSIKPKEWKIQWGDKEIPVTSDMVVHALDQGISTVHKEIATNRVIRSDTRMKIDWEQSVLILELVREQFDILRTIDANRQLNMKIPSGKAN